MRQPALPSTVPLRLLLAFGLVFAAALHAAWSTLDRYFLSDDFAYIGRFYHFPLRDWPTLFVHDWSGGIWGQTLPELRPFAALTFLVDTRLWGVNPLGYHVTNLILDTGCAWLVALIVWRLHAAALWAGCAAGILFAWHPAHAEPVAWITGRVDLLGTLAYLAGFFAGGSYLRTGGRRWLAAAWLAYGIGCFSKEFCLTLPVALLLWMLFYRPLLAPGRLRQTVLLFAGFVAVAAVFVLCRRIAFGSGNGGVTALHLFSAAFAERQFDYLRWALPLFYDFGRDYRPLLLPFAPALIVGSLLVSLAVLALWHWKGPATTRWRAVAFFGLVWYAVAFAAPSLSGHGRTLHQRGIAGGHPRLTAVAGVRVDRAGRAVFHRPFQPRGRAVAAFGQVVRAHRPGGRPLGPATAPGRSPAAGRARCA